ncbi:MAG: 3-dehydroquinate synthase, partial [Clostridiales bacterium]
MTKTVNGSGYQIHIGSGLLAQTGKYLAAYHGCKSCIVSDSNVAPLYGNRLFASLQKEGLQPFLVTVPAGEISKSADQLLAVYGELAAH